MPPPSQSSSSGSGWWNPDRWQYCNSRQRAEPYQTPALRLLTWNPNVAPSEPGPSDDQGESSAARSYQQRRNHSAYPPNYDHTWSNLRESHSNRGNNVHTVGNGPASRSVLPVVLESVGEATRQVRIEPTLNNLVKKDQIGRMEHRWYDNPTRRLDTARETREIRNGDDHFGHDASKTKAHEVTQEHWMSVRHELRQAKIQEQEEPGYIERNFKHIVDRLYTDTGSTLSRIMPQNRFNRDNICSAVNLYSDPDK